MRSSSCWWQDPACVIEPCVTVQPVRAARLHPGSSGSGVSATRQVVKRGLADDGTIWSMESLHLSQEGTAVAAGGAVTSIGQQHGQQHLVSRCRTTSARVARASSGQGGGTRSDLSGIGVGPVARPPTPDHRGRAVHLPLQETSCLPGGGPLAGDALGLRALSHDGRTLAAIDWSDPDGGGVREFTVTMIDFATG
jgi:hypothetical protein